MRMVFAACSAAAVLSAAAATAHASFHLMQIEQVIGGVNGDTSLQAIQLRMRSGSQIFIAGTQVRVYDAAGQNPITIVTFPSNVSNGAAGSRILIASAGFATATNPACVPDFTMQNLIPASYMAAGRLAFQTSFGTIYWSVSWGGAAYTGPQTGDLSNDANGNFGPAFASPLPSTTLQALQFQGPASAPSTTNAANYLITTGAAVFTNNAGATFTVVAPPNPCPQDFNGDGEVNADDLSDYITCFFTHAGSPGSCPAAEFNGDGEVNADDLSDYITAFFGPPC